MKTIFWSKVRILVTEVKQKHNKKLEKLGINTFEFKSSSKFINKSRNRIDKIELFDEKQTIYNLSDRILDNDEINLLNKGLKFGITPKKVDEYEILANFEILSQRLNTQTTEANKDERKTEIDTKVTFLKSLQSCAFEFLDLSKIARDNLTQDERKALDRLTSDKSIIITKADKGNAVVIQNIHDYKTKVTQLLTEDGKFKRIEVDDTLKREHSLQQKLRRLWNQGKFTDSFYNIIMPCGSRAGIIFVFIFKREIYIIS
jgi:hypothetical protein